MNKKISNSGALFGLVIFMGLMPLAFRFSSNGPQLLLETSFKYFIWLGQVAVLLLLILTKHNLSKKQCIGLAILFLFVLFVFTFNKSGAHFLILNKYISSIFSWVMAGVLLSKLILLSKLKKKSNF